MNAAYKTTLTSVLKCDPDDQEFSSFIHFMETHNKSGMKMSSSANQKIIQDSFIAKSKEFLNLHSKTYQETKKLLSITGGVDASLDKIESLVAEIIYHDKLLLAKINKLQAKDRDNLEKQHHLSQLIEDCNIKQNTLKILVEEKKEVNEEFFIAFEALDKFTILQQSLSKKNAKISTLSQSLQSNLAEVRHIAYAKLIKHLNTNIETIDEATLKKSIRLLKQNKEFYSKFLKNFIKIRKIKNSFPLAEILNNFKLIYDKEYIRFFTDIFSTLSKLIQEELTYLLDVFGDDTAKESLLEKVFEDIINDIYKKTEKHLFNEQDYFNMSQILNIIDFHISAIRLILSQQKSKKDEKVREMTAELGEIQVIELLEKIRQQSDSIFKRNINTLASRLISTRFNIQNSSSYLIIRDYLGKVKYISNSFDERHPKMFIGDHDKTNPIDEQQKITGKSAGLTPNPAQKTVSKERVELLLRPVLDLAIFKLNEYNKAVQSCIFSVNLYMLTLREFDGLDWFSENREKIMVSVKDLCLTISSGIFSEFSRMFELDSLDHACRRRNPEDLHKESVKKIANFLLEFQEKEKYKLLIRDVNLIQDEQIRKDISTNLISNFIEKYKIYYKYLTDFSTQSKLEDAIKPGKLKQLFSTVGVDKGNDKEMSLYEVEEMSGFLKQSLL